jgi:hypothetical protein
MSFESGNYENLGLVMVEKLTAKAVLLEGRDAEPFWVPQSVIFEDDLAELEEGELMEINVKKWFYDKEFG